MWRVTQQDNFGVMRRGEIFTDGQEENNCKKDTLFSWVHGWVQIKKAPNEIAKCLKLLVTQRGLEPLFPA
jgi:hypothetical protein